MLGSMNYKSFWRGWQHMSTCSCRKGGRRYSDCPFQRVLEANARGCPYRRFKAKVEHLGQLKLLISEIEFLTPYRGKRMTVVYAGAAPGLHVPSLLKLFRGMHFVLVDPMPSVVKPAANVEVIQRAMTVDLAWELAKRFGRAVLFISDVRTAPPSKEADRDAQLRIQKDMEAQLDWHAALDPVASMFKFRLPWSLTPYTKYPKGRIHLPVYGKAGTHETRLIVRRGAPMVSYDNRRYEAQMAFFNQHQREALFDDALCYDCTAFRRIVADCLGLGRIETETMCRRLEDEIEKAKLKKDSAPLTAGPAAAEQDDATAPHSAPHAR